MFNSNDYAKDKAYRSDKMRQAGRDHLAKAALAGSTHRFELEPFVYAHRRAVIAVTLVVLAVVLMMALPRMTNAHDLADPGEGELFAPAIMAYRIGHYYYVAGNYDRAIEEYTKAIEGIPPVVFEKSADYAVMYWDMGDAQLMAGEHENALMSYRRFLELLDEKASQRAIEFVERLEAGIAQGVVNLTPLAA